MKIKQEFLVAVTSITLSIVVLVSSGESRASAVLVNQYANNNLVKHSHEISQKLTVVQSVVFQSALGNLVTGKDNFFPCWNQERSPVTSSIELLMRLLIIGSFGSAGIAGYSSFVERYFQIINKDLKVIYYSIFLLVSLQIIGSVIVLMSSPTSQSYSAISPSSSCISSKVISF